MRPRSRKKDPDSMKSLSKSKSKPKPTKTGPAKAKTTRTEIQSIIADIKTFRDERDWEKFHDAKNLAICLNVEAGELLEVFLWKSENEIKVDRLKEELADVFYSAFLLADKYRLDVGRIVRDKLKQNAEKYPKAKSKGSNKKYTEI